jgi:phosphoglycolate phosphatase
MHKGTGVDIFCHPGHTSGTMKPTGALGPFSAILFDFDGTLAHLNVDFGAMKAGLLSLLNGYGLDTDPFKDLYALEMVEAASDMLKPERVADSNSLRTQGLALIKEIEMEGARKGCLFTGVEEMFRILKNRNIKTSIVTRNCFDAVNCIFPDIESRCDAVITREFTDQVKPHPGHLATALVRLNISKGEKTVMAGDHPMDINAGKAVGAYTIGVLSGYSTESLLRCAGADLIMERITDLVV